jgi:hypothetical protein
VRPAANGIPSRTGSISRTSSKHHAPHIVPDRAGTPGFRLAAAKPQRNDAYPLESSSALLVNRRLASCGAPHLRHTMGFSPP